MKVCATCHTDLPKESYSKKQWKLDEFQRRCKVCIADNREVQQPSKQDNNNYANTNEIIKSLESMYLEDVDKISDEDLFKQPPAQEDCHICFLRLPSLDTGRRYMTCCGKMICSGCICAPLYDDQGNKVNNKKCPFCRTPDPTLEEVIKRTKMRVEAGDPIAIHNLGVYYSDGLNGYSQDHVKALELCRRAAELGHADAYNIIGCAYNNGEAVEGDEKKAMHFYKLGAIKGNAEARYNLGNMEGAAGNVNRAMKHHMIAIESGEADSLKMIEKLYTNGHATKADYTTALRLYQTYLVEIKSV